jgi:hypothetical protein
MDLERILKMLDAWEVAENCYNWPLALKSVQLQTNCQVHPGK